MCDLQVAWYMGYPLSQTLFTSIYINLLLWPEPQALEKAQFTASANTISPLVQKVLRSYCLATVKSGDFFRGMVISQHYFEVSRACLYVEVSTERNRKRILQRSYFIENFCVALTQKISSYSLMMRLLG